METLLHDLGGILVNALPTAFLVIILGIYLKYMLFKPVDKVLAERYALTEGARKAADESLRNADSRVSEYEGKLDAARAEIYRDQEAFLRTVHNEQAERVRDLRDEMERRVAEIKLALDRDANAAKESLEVQSEILAAQIADTLLNRRIA